MKRAVAALTVLATPLLLVPAAPTTDITPPAQVSTALFVERAPMVKVSRSKIRKTPVVRRVAVRSRPVGRSMPRPKTTAWIETVRLCIMRHESGGNPKAHNPSGASGLYQFMPITFRAVTGLPGNAADYSPAVQTAAFYTLFAGGRGARNWVTAGMCGA